MNKYVLMVASVLVLISCKDKKQSTGTELLPIDVSSPVVKNIVLTKEYPGYLSSNKTVSLVARVDGYITESYLVPGAPVKAGDLIFVIEPTSYHNQVLQSEAQLATSKAQYEYAESNYERMKIAAESGAVSQIQVLEAAATAKEQAASIATAEAELNTARTNLEYCYVRAPYDGHITKANYDVGNYVAGAAEAVTLATLYKDDSMYAYFNIEESTLMTMIAVQKSNKLPDSLHNKVTVKCGLSKEVSFPGVIDYMSPDVDVSTGTLNMRAVVNHKKGILKDGLYVNVILPYCVVDSAILVTNSSVGTDQLGKYLFVVNDSNVVQYRHIVVGQVVNDTLIEVTSGLKPTENYVTSALLKVRNGMKIKPIKR